MTYSSLSNAPFNDFNAHDINVLFVQAKLNSAHFIYFMCHTA